MHDGLTDAGDLEALWGRLDREVEAMRNSGVQLARNEAEYRKALRVLVLSERQKGTPVTVISDICRGEPRIASLREARDCSEAIYRASQEAINVLKLRIRVLDAQMGREWGQAR